MGQSIDTANVTGQAADRGTIIVDSSVFWGLCADIPETNPPKKYLEILPFLAKNGYHIVIPEMVSYESGQILASASYVGDVFAKSSNLSKAQKILKPFLKAVAQKEFPNIEIVRGTGPAEIDSFCKNIQSEMDNLNTRLLEIKVSRVDVDNKTKVIFEETRKRIMGISDVKTKLGKDYGDEAIISLIAKDYHKKVDKPVFVFTDDHELRDRIKHGFSCAKAVTAGEITYSLVDSGLAERIGFPAGIDTRSLEEQRRISLRDLGVSNYTKQEKHLSNTEYSNNVRSSLFAQSLEALLNDLRQEESTKKSAAVEEANPADNDPVNKYIARFEKFDKFRKSTRNSGELPAK